MMLPAFALALVVAAVFFVMLRVNAPRWTFVVLGVLPPAALLLMSPSLRVYGYHGFVQAGIVYQLLNGNLPPNSPLLAGQPGTYPWAGPLLLAGISKVLGISPFWSAALVAMASLVVLLMATYRIGLLVTGDAKASLFGVTAALYAFTFTQSVPDSALKRALDALLPFPFVEPRGAPMLEKFNGCTAFPLGLALYALALLFLLRLTRRGAIAWRELAALAGSVLALAFVYPFFFPPLALLCLAAALMAWRSGARGEGWRLALALVGLLVPVGMAVLPYYHHLRIARSSPVLQLVPLPGLVRQAGVIVVTLLPMLALIFWARRAVVGTLRAHGKAALLLLASAGLNLALFTFLLAPLWSQYKFLLLATFALGIVGGLAFRHLHERSWLAAFVVLTLFLVPFGLEWVHKATDWKTAPRVFRESGATLGHTDPDQEALYHWIRTETDPGAVFVDTDLGLPVYGQRSLFVALPPQEEIKELATRGGDGYALDLRIILKDVDGYPSDLVDRRIETARRLLSGNGTPDDLAAVNATGPVAYLVLRPDAAGGTPLTRIPLGMVYKSPAATVLKLRRASDARRGRR